MSQVRSSRPAESYRNTNRGKYFKLDYFVLEELLMLNHLGSLTAANWVSFDFNVAYSSR